MARIIGAYNICKAADFLLVCNLAPELEQLGTRIYAVAPGVIRCHGISSGLGHVVLLWIWLGQSLACAVLDDKAFAADKRRAYRFFFICELPRAQQWLVFVASLSDVVAQVPVEQL